MKTYTKPANDPVKPGDCVEGYFQCAGDEAYYSSGQHVVRSVDSNGTPYVRFKHGKVSKPISHWQHTPTVAASPSSSVRPAAEEGRRG